MDAKEEIEHLKQCIAAEDERIERIDAQMAELEYRKNFAVSYRNQLQERLAAELSQVSA